MLRCLTKLYLQNVDFEKLDMHRVMFDCCKQLKHLSLCSCDTDTYSVFQIVYFDRVPNMILLKPLHIALLVFQ